LTDIRQMTSGVIENLAHFATSDKFKPQARAE